jgi:hypothetical protein
MTNNLITAALAGEYYIEVMGPHFTKYHRPGGTVLHHFTADDGGAIHDHPWSFHTTILKGGYVEHIYTDDGTYTEHHRHEGETRHVPAATIHTITRLLGDECWTLVTPGPWEQHTRFYRVVDGGLESRQWDEGWP